ncbi:hypothetical protein [Mycobacterium sp. PSTR-4-N]|uniref:hypothetical protein n=1 Tax=Mycobacterium sp. PSTR-4-N TaxID=2917745 RepID=UPI001F152540|nr:hypothetical protein [Mycobacterium sp. PSTR-4-N]MCG7592771.1 hypothetical protein [Mycobacterium sp. PSTR-4-N]
MTWVLVALGGAIGSTIGALLLRRPSSTRLVTATAVVCGLAGMLSTQRVSPGVTAVLGYGVLGSAASMVAFTLASPMWVGGDAPVRSTVSAGKKVGVYCAVGVTFALLGYLAVRGGATLYRKIG